MLFAPFVATYFGLQYRRAMVKREVKWKMIAGLDKSELVLLKFSKKDQATKLRWKHSKEFEYEHQMYDIVDKKFFGDSVYYWCWWDYEETKLNKQLAELVQHAWGKDSQNKKKQEELSSYFKGLFCVEISDWNTNLMSCLSIDKEEKEFYFLDNYLSYSSIPPIPPPWYLTNIS